MANTTRLKNDVEKWYLQTLIVDKENENIKKEEVDLIWGGKFEFDAVIREENEIVEVHCLSTSKFNTGQLHKIKDDALMLTGVRHSIRKVIAFTDSTLHKKVKMQQEKGRFPKDIELKPLVVEDEINNIIIQLKTESIKEQKSKISINMKKLVLSLSILLTSMSISAQLTQVSQYWDIYRTNLQKQYTVIKATNEKQGVYKAWSADRNLILECNYAKDKLQGQYTEYYDTPGLKVSTTVNYKNDEKDGWETVYQWYPKNYLGFEGKEQYYLKYKQEYKHGIASQNRVEFTEENDTLVYSRQIEDKIFLKSGFWSNKATERFEIKKLKDEKIYEKQWKKINNNWILTYNKDDNNKIWVYYYDNGNKRLEGVDGAPDFIGHKEITYSENGKLQTIKSFKKGEEECFYLATYDENGKIIKEQRTGEYTNSYENGLLARKDTSDYTLLYYANGKMRKAINNKLHFEANYDENETLLNKIDGDYEEKYSIENGNKTTILYYQKKPISKYINDKLRFEVKDNITTEYNENGNKTSEVSYKQGQAPYVQTSDGRYYEIGSFYYEKSYSTIGEATIEVKKEFDTSGNLSSLKETVYKNKDKDGTDIVVTDITYNTDGTVKTELKRTNKDRSVIYTIFEYEYPKEKQKIKSKQEIKKITF